MPSGSSYTYVGNTDPSNKIGVIYTTQGPVEIGGWGYFLPDEYDAAVGVGCVLSPGENTTALILNPIGNAYTGNDGTLGGIDGTPLNKKIVLDVNPGGAIPINSFDITDGQTYVYDADSGMMVPGAGGGGGSLRVTDGTTTVDDVTEVSFTGATVTNAEDGTADVDVTGGGFVLSSPLVYVVNESPTYILSSAELLQITSEGWTSPVWNPTKTKFVASFSHDDSIWIFDADGTNPTQITNFSTGVTNAGPGGYPLGWSPDGTQIAVAYYSESGSGNVAAAGIELIRIDNSGFTDILLASDVEQYYTIDTGTIKWSPDGTKFAYLGGTALAGDEVRICNADGSGITIIGAATSDIYWELYDWYSDSEHVLVSANNSNGEAILYKLKIDGTTTVIYDGVNDGSNTPTTSDAIIGNFGQFGTAALSPDETQIAINTDNGIVIIPAAGGGAITSLPPPPYAVNQIDW